MVALVHGEGVGHALLSERRFHVDVHREDDVLEGLAAQVVGKGAGVTAQRLGRHHVVHEAVDPEGLRAVLAVGPTVHGQVRRHVASEVRLIGDRVAQCVQCRRERTDLRRQRSSRSRSGGGGQRRVGDRNRRLDAHRQRDHSRLRRRCEQEVVRPRDRHRRRPLVGMLQPQLVRPVPAEGDAGDGSVLAALTRRQIRFDKRRQLVDEEALELRRRRAVARLVAAGCIARVPVRVVAVHPRLRAVPAGQGLSQRRHQDDSECGRSRQPGDRHHLVKRTLQKKNASLDGYNGPKKLDRSLR